MNNIHGNRILGDTLHRNGSGYVARCDGPFLRANDPWFRGMQIKYGPDGSVYISDWHDFGECHDTDGSHRTTGRIYKVTYGTTDREDFNLALASNLGLARLHDHPNAWFSRHARRLLQERSCLVMSLLV